jgi:hypothetical protein
VRFLIVRSGLDDALEIEIDAVEVARAHLADQVRSEGVAVVLEGSHGLGPVPVTGVVVDAEQDLHAVLARPIMKPADVALADLVEVSMGRR